MPSNLAGKRKRSDIDSSLDTSTSERTRALTRRDQDAPTDSARRSTAAWDNCVAYGNASVHNGHTYILNQHIGGGETQPSQDTTERVDFMEALEFDGMESRYESIDPAILDTCRWLSTKSEYIQWRDSNCSDFLWIKGKAGSGKSTLMKYALDHARKTYLDEKVVSFFFNARSSQRLERSVEGMYRSVISQIICHFPELRAKYPRYSPKSVRRDGWELSMLRNYFGKAVRSLGSGQAMTIYVDALDECDEDEIRAAIEHFEELRCAPIHICFASRHYPQVTVQQCIELSLEDQHEHQNDIRRYIDHKLTIRNIGRKTRLATEIEARSSGVFLWVVLVVRLIRKKSDNGEPYSELLRTLHEIPDALQSLIGVILESPDAELLCALRWVLFAYDHVTVPELYFAIRISSGHICSGAYDPAEANCDDMKAFIIKSSRGLIEMNANLRGRPGLRAQLVHESVREYILDGGVPALGPCSDEGVQASIHTELFRCCRAYLRLVSGRVIDIAKRGKTPNQVVHETYPLLVYATSFVLEHFEDSLSAGLLCLCSLRDLALELLIGTDFEYKDGFRPIQRQLAEPHRYSTSLLYLAIRGSCKKIAEAIITAEAAFTSSPDDDSLANARAHVCECPRGDLDVNARFDSGWPSLLDLSLEKCPDITELLLDHGAYVPPLELAVEQYGRWFVQLLLSRSSLAQDQIDALFVHAARKLNVQVVEHFLQTSLHVSVRVQALEAALAASDRDYSIWAQKDLGAGDTHLRIVQLLLHADVGVIESYADFRTQALDAILRSTDWKLWYGGYRGPLRRSPGAVRLIAMKRLLGIEGGIDFYGFDGDCETALVAAAAVGQSDLVKYLLERGADPHHRSAECGRPVDVALRRRHTEVVSILQAASTAPIGPSSTRMISSASVRPSTQL